MTRPRVVGNEGERGSDAGWWWWWRSLVGRWQKAEEKDEGEQVNAWLVKAVAEESGADGDTKAVVAAGAVVRAQPRVKDDDDDDDNIFLFMANVVCFFLFLLFEVVVVEQDDSSTRGSVTIMPTSNEIFFFCRVEMRSQVDSEKTKTRGHETECAEVMNKKKNGKKGIVARFSQSGCKLQHRPWPSAGVRPN